MSLKNTAQIIAEILFLQHHLLRR